MGLQPCGPAQFLEQLKQALRLECRGLSPQLSSGVQLLLRREMPEAFKRVPHEVSRGMHRDARCCGCGFSRALCRRPLCRRFSHSVSDLNACRFEGDQPYRMRASPRTLSNRHELIVFERHNRVMTPTDTGVAPLIAALRHMISKNLPVGNPNFSEAARAGLHPYAATFSRPKFGSPCQNCLCYFLCYLPPRNLPPNGSAVFERKIAFRSILTGLPRV